MDKYLKKIHPVFITLDDTEFYANIMSKFQILDIIDSMDNEELIILFTIINLYGTENGKIKKPNIMNLYKFINNKEYVNSLINESSGCGCSKKKW